jgi:hypothetical protein
MSSRINGGAKPGHAGAAVFRGGSVGLSGAALSETIVVAVHLEDVDVVGDAVEQRAGETLGSQCFRPFVKRKVAGDQGGSAFIALRDQLSVQINIGMLRRVIRV